MSENVKETKELIVGACQVFADVAKNGTGKLALIKTLVSDVGDVVTALAGVEQVPAELKDLTEDEAEEIYLAAAEKLGGTLDHEMREAVHATATAVFAGVAAGKLWKAIAGRRHTFIPPAEAVTE